MMVTEQKNDLLMQCEACSDTIGESDLAFVHGVPHHLGCVDPEELGKYYVAKNLQEEFDRMRVYTNAFGDFLTDLYAASLATVPSDEVGAVELLGGEDDTPTEKEAGEVNINTSVMLSAAIKAAAKGGPEAVDALCDLILDAGKKSSVASGGTRLFTNA
jgi:hypothetical protein